MSLHSDVHRPAENPAISAWYSWVDEKSGCVILDGGLGSILSERGNDLSLGSLWSGRLLHMNPDELRAVAWAWLSAGADIITTATYQISEDVLRKELDLSSEEAEQVMLSAWRILDAARKNFWSSLAPSQRSLRRYAKIAISLGPFSALREDTDEYSGLYENVSQEDFHNFHHRRATIFAQQLVLRDAEERDVLCYETIGNPCEAVAIAEVMSGPELRGTPYWMSFQCRDSSRLASGASLSSTVDDVLNACRYKNLVAIGVNCVEVQDVTTLITALQATLRCYMASDTQRSWRVDTMAYPNSGESWSNNGWVWSSGKALVPSSWAHLLRSSDAKILGGCCRTSPAHISALHLIRLSEAMHS